MTHTIHSATGSSVPSLDLICRQLRRGTGCLILLTGLIVGGLPMVSCPSASAQQISSSALINEQLDKVVKLDINATLPRAMQAIGDQTGVRIIADPIVWDLLPWGQDTNIQAKIENQTLRQGLTAITRKLGLTFELTDEAVQVQPMPALRRLGRRASLQELEALDYLSITPANPGNQPLTPEQALALIDQRLVDAKSPFAIENRAGIFAPGEAGTGTAGTFARNATLMDVLETLSQRTNATWYPWGKSIVILPKIELTRSLLNKTISVRYDGVDVQQVLLELSQRAGVPFSIEPGAITKIAPEAHNIRLILDNTSISQALDTIGGFTGLGYRADANRVYIWYSLPTPQSAAASRDPVEAILHLDNGVDVLLKHSEIPDDLRAYIQHRTQKQFDALRTMMKEENFTPPPPATQPAAPAEKKLTGNEDL